MSTPLLSKEKLFMATADNLKEAFAGESQANRMYLAFAKKAEAEGFKQIARLFRAAAEAETVHALAHFRVQGGVKSTAENLQTAINGEGYEYTVMYPKFVAEAQEEDNQAAFITFKNAMAVERIHQTLYKKALESLQAGNDLSAAKIYVCPVCGNTVIGEVSEKCDICGVSKERFFEVS